MAEMKLYHLPGACSRVTLTALEQVGVPYTDKIVNLMQGQQNSPAYRAINPNGKVPVLIADGQPLTENAAILWWLNQTFPAAGLLPQPAEPFAQARIMADLFWLSAGWHPAVRACRMPVRWTTGDIAPVRERGKQLMDGLMHQLDARLQANEWWYGDRWSIVDTYFYWNYTTAEEGEYSLAGMDTIAAHRQRIEAHPPFQRALAREQLAQAAALG